MSKQMACKTMLVRVPGHSESLRVSFTDEDDVLSIKEKLEVMTGLEMFSQTLLLCGSEMRNGETMSEVGMKADMTVHLIVPADVRKEIELSREAKQEIRKAKAEMEKLEQAVAEQKADAKDVEDAHRLEETKAAEWRKINQGLADAHEQVHTALPEPPPPVPVEEVKISQSEKKELLQIWKSRASAAKGCLIGLFVGDALGLPADGMRNSRAATTQHGHIVGMVRSGDGRSMVDQGGIMTTDSLPGYFPPSLFGRPSHGAAQVVEGRRTWMDGLLERSNREYAFATAGSNPRESETIVRAFCDISRDQQPKAPPVKAGYRPPKSQGRVQQKPSMDTWDAGKGSGAHRWRRVKRGGNSADAMMTRNVIMRSIEEHRGFDVKNVQHELIDFFASETRPGPYVPSHALAYLASYARGGRADKWGGNPQDINAQPAAVLIHLTPLILAAELHQAPASTAPVEFDTVEMRCGEVSRPEQHIRAVTKAKVTAYLDAFFPLDPRLSEFLKMGAWKGGAPDDAGLPAVNGAMVSPTTPAPTPRCTAGTPPPACPATLLLLPPARPDASYAAKHTRMSRCTAGTSSASTLHCDAEHQMMMPLAGVGQTGLRRHSLVWADGLKRLLEGDSMRGSVSYMAQQLGVHLADLLRMGSDSDVIEHAYDANSSHADHVMPAVLYLAFKYGERREQARVAMLASAAIAGESAIRTALLGAIFGCAFGTDAIPAEWRFQCDRVVVEEEEERLALDLKSQLLTKADRQDKARFKAREVEAKARGSRDIMTEQAEAEHEVNTNSLNLLATMTKLKEGPKQRRQRLLNFELNGTLSRLEVEYQVTVGDGETALTGELQAIRSQEEGVKGALNAIEEGMQPFAARVDSLSFSRPALQLAVSRSHFGTIDSVYAPLTICDPWLADGPLTTPRGAIVLMGAGRVAAQAKMRHAQEAGAAAGEAGGLSDGEQVVLVAAEDDARAAAAEMEAEEEAPSESESDVLRPTDIAIPVAVIGHADGEAARARAGEMAMLEIKGQLSLCASLDAFVLSILPRKVRDHMTDRA